MNVYERTDRAVKAINRYNLERFGRLKMAKFDELNVIREVTATYQDSMQMVRKKLRKAAEEDFIFFLMLCRWDELEATQKAKETQWAAWVDELMQQVDPATRYRFDLEEERKQARLIESLAIPLGQQAEVDKGLRLWTKQIAQFAIYVTDSAAKEAFEAAGVDEAMWNTEQDDRVCEECDEREGNIYKIGQIPDKPHRGCRCWLTPVI